MQQLSGGLRTFLLLMLLSLVFFLPGSASVPSLDRDESRFVQATRQMVESGDYIRIKFQDEYRAKKPVGIYWLQAASVTAFKATDRIWAYRLPSVLGAMLAVLLTFHFGQSLFGRSAAFIGAALLATSLVLVSEAHQAKTDAVLLACVVAAQGVLGRFYTSTERRSWDVLIFWVAQGVGILIKGPIVPLISVLTIAALWIADRRINWLRGIRPLSGLLLVILIVGPWVVAISTMTDGQFLGTAVKTDLLPKLLGAQESHGAPPGYYVLLSPLLLWPISLFVIPGVVRAVIHRMSPGARFCLAWIVPAWLLFEIVPTKLPHYVLPTFPALALLAGLVVANDDPLLRNRWIRGCYFLLSLIGLAVTAALVIVPWKFGHVAIAHQAIAVASALTASLLPMLLAWRGYAQPAVTAAILGGALTYASLFQLILPNLNQFWLSRDVAAAIPSHTPAAAAGYHEPSLVFLLGTSTQLTDGTGAAAFLLSTPRAAAVVEDAQENDFQKALAGRTAHVIASMEGFNYSRGRPAHLKVWQLDTHQ